jgi:opacity protein-like surface antigen
VLNIKSSLITPILLGIVAMTSHYANAQSWEVGGALGASNYHGDLAYNISPKETHFSGGIFINYNFNEYWSYRPTLSYLKISGADSNFNDYQLRNLSFRNNMYEFSNALEFNFHPFSSRDIHTKATFYATAGVSIFMHKPEAYLDGEWYDLSSLATENQDYSLIHFAIPLGGGIKYAVTDNLILGFETAWRRTFTDYLDDVSGVYSDIENADGSINKLVDRSWELTSDGRPLANAGDTRGNPNLNDWFIQSIFKISYRFTPIKCPY